MIAPQQQINSTAHARCFTTPVKVNGRRLTAMVGSGATGNFMARTLVNREGYTTQAKSDAYNLMVIDGNPLPDGNGRVDRETKPLPVAIQQHHEELTFDIVGMATHDIVLGMPWLKQHNPEVDWSTREIRFERCDCHLVQGRSQSVRLDRHRQRSVRP